ncbi:MAG: glycosyl transferase family 2 [Bacteroidales bacterium]|nr:glycosyl transferase family 2 [Bacteroidales bacterium]
MKIGIIIQARLGSSRLPGKILLPFFDGKCILDIIIDKAKSCRETSVIVATSVDPSNDELVRHLEGQDVCIYRGSEKDVLSRFVIAAEENNLDGVIRICSDNPFLDLESLCKLCDEAMKQKADYIGFMVNETPSIKTHFGFWAEYASCSALKRVAELTPPNSLAHEHVTWYLYNHPDEFVCKWLETNPLLQGRSDIRLTVDTREDFENIKVLFSLTSELYDSCSIDDIVHFLDEHPSFLQTMKSEIKKNEK